MSKLGTLYQNVVAQVVKELDPTVSIDEGQWIKGPDGEREIDVIINGTVNGSPRRIHIECRDYNPRRRTIGIAAIDALESKHRDLGSTISILCSNAGFSPDAVRKAQRVGIPLIGVLREGDSRIRYSVIDAIYIRRIDVVQNSVDFSFEMRGLKPLGKFALETITYKGLLVKDWLASRILIFLCENPVVKGTHKLKYDFVTPVIFETDGGPALATSISIKFSIEGQWFMKRVEIDATSGFYDWVRNTVRIGPARTSITYKNASSAKGGKAVKSPPNFDPNKDLKLISGEKYIWIIDLGGYAHPKAIPDLSKYVVASQLQSRRYDLRMKDCVS